MGVRGEKGRTSDNVSVQLVCSWFAVGLEIAASGSWFAVGLQLVSKLGGSLSWFPVGFLLVFAVLTKRKHFQARPAMGPVEHVAEWNPLLDEWAPFAPLVMKKNWPLQ